MRQMSRRDAQLYYDGRVPPGVIDESLPDRLAAPPPLARIGKVTEKPASIIARMGAAIAAMATDRGIVEIADLKRLGFTDAQIAAHGDDARAQAMFLAPTVMLQVIEAGL